VLRKLVRREARGQDFEEPRHEFKIVEGVNGEANVAGVIVEMYGVDAESAKG
jgi:hypothetical protein